MAKQLIMTTKKMMKYLPHHEQLHHQKRLDKDIEYIPTNFEGVRQNI